MVSEIITSLYIYLEDVLGGFVSDLVTAVIILLIGFILSKIIGKSLQRALYELELDRTLRRLFSFYVSIEEIIGQTITYIGYFITVVLALNQLQVTTPVLYIISTLVVAMVVLSVLLAIKDYVPNLFAGFLISHRKFVNTGDYIRIGKIEGEITRIGLSETIIKTSSGDIVAIPSAKMIKTEIIKLKRSETERQSN